MDIMIVILYEHPDFLVSKMGLRIFILGTCILISDYITLQDENTHRS